MILEKFDSTRNRNMTRSLISQPSRRTGDGKTTHDSRRNRRNDCGVIAMDNPDPDSAHIVSLTEKNWLKANGCDEDPSPEIHMASRNADSGGFGL